MFIKSAPKHAYHILIEICSVCLYDAKLFVTYLPDHCY